MSKRNKIVLPPRPDDVDEAKLSQLKSQTILAKLEAQENYVSRLGDRMAYVVEARKYDHFGDDLQKSFTRARKGTN
jgi:hypothetical protein